MLHFSTCKFFLLAQAQPRVGFRNRKSHSAWGKKKKNFFSSTIIMRYWEMKTRVDSLPCQHTAHTAPALMHLLRLRHNHVAGQSCSSASLFCEDAFASRWVPFGGVSYSLISVKCSLFLSVFLLAFDFLAHPSNLQQREPWFLGNCLKQGGAKGEREEQILQSLLHLDWWLGAGGGENKPPEAC